MPDKRFLDSKPARKSQSTAKRRSRARRARRRRQRRLRLVVIALCTLLIGLIAVLAGRAHHRSTMGTSTAAPATALSVTAAVPAEQMPGITVCPTMTPTATAAPTPEPTPSPEPTTTPHPRLAGMPDVISFYTPGGHHTRVRLGDTFLAAWKKGKDIGSFEVIASDADTLTGKYFSDIFGQAWTVFPAADQCKIGYTLSYTLADGQQIRFSMLSPKHVAHTEYIECWLYDDYHQEPGKRYSHLRKADEDTLITSIKLTCGPKIDEVQEIRLTAFVCASLDDFDDDRNYIGDVSRTIVIRRK